MPKKLLIDTSHAEEVRIAVVNNENLEEFDSEATKKQNLKSNIYLAKVIRIEPSLQAAFVEYGGNRHGFLPFAEIHTDYFQIPVSDRTEEEPEAPLPEAEASEDEAITSKAAESENSDAINNDAVDDDTDAKDIEIITDAPDPDDVNDDDDKKDSERPLREKSLHSKYKIQEVLKRRQILLVQVSKEERGNKGAALTTFLSLAGRYCVLMPNAGKRGGGISRKIDNPQDRKRLKDIISKLDIADGMSLIVRTAGQTRNKAEIKRDYEYILKIWAEIRELTLKSIAPCLIHQEGDLITRAIRDVYNRDIDAVLVEGDEAYKSAKNLMKQMMPSHARKVQAYKDKDIPMFHKFRIEEQIDTMMHPVATLPSGGYIVINPTEALVSIDVNSGKSTKERNIDDTAFKTNMEAAEEIARQLRLRDLAGLIVIDFIDMYENRSAQQVEKKLKESLSVDRARIQVGRISQFGLLEMSRQRLRPSLMETHSIPCTHCNGSGHIRSTESLALQILRAIETEALKGKSSEISITVPNGADLYLLNNKRSHLTQLEDRFDIRILVNRDMSMASTLFEVETTTFRDADHEVEPETEDKPRRVEAKQKPAEKPQNKKVRRPQKPKKQVIEDQKEDEQAPKNDGEKSEDLEKSDEPQKKRRRRTRNKPRRDGDDAVKTNDENVTSGDSEKNDGAVNASEKSEEKPRKNNEDIADSENGEKKQNRRPRRNRFRQRKNRQGESNDGSAPIENNKDKDRGTTKPAEKITAIPTRPTDMKIPKNEPKKDSGEKKQKGGWLRRLLDA